MSLKNENEQLRTRMGEMAAEIERLATDSENWLYYQGLLKFNGFTGITDLLAKFHARELENARLQSVIDEANAQEPFARMTTSADDDGKTYHTTIDFRDDMPLCDVPSTVNLYARPIPAQQSVDRDTIIDVLLSIGNMSEGIIADAIISAIGAQQSPAVAVLS